MYQNLVLIPSSYPLLSKMMKEISVFLASSGKLSQERAEVETLISRMNDALVHKGIYLKLRIWEKISSTFAVGRKQDEFNNEVFKSDIFICLVHDRIGQFSKEEFDCAYEGLQTSGKPRKMYVYFNNTPIRPDEIPEDYNTVSELKDQIKRFEQIYDSYDNIDELIRKVKNHLDLDIPELTQNSLSEELISILNGSNPGVFEHLRDNSAVSILLTSDEYDRLQLIVAELEEKKVMKFTSNGNMIQNRPDGKMRTGFVAEKLENYKI